MADPSGGHMKDLVKNPLGIVALFISLIYGFANLLLGATVSSLTENERVPLIIFIVLFPVVVLGVFYLLVTRHHGKLYAPGDYKDDKSFLRTLSYEEQQERLEREVKEALPDNAALEMIPTQGNLPLPPDPGTVGLAAENSSSVTHSVSEVAGELRKIEDAALRKLEREYGGVENRDIAIAGVNVSYDALLRSTGGKYVFAEVKTLRAPLRMSSMLDRVLYNAVLADRYLDGRFKLILVVVYFFDRSELARIESLWRKRVEQCPASIELRFAAREELDL